MNADDKIFFQLKSFTWHEFTIDCTFSNCSMTLSETYTVNASEFISIYADTWFKRDLMSSSNKIILSFNVLKFRIDLDVFIIFRKSFVLIRFSELDKSNFWFIFKTFIIQSTSALMFVVKSIFLMIDWECSFQNI